MKHILTTLLLAVALPVMAQTLDSRIPISVVKRDLTRQELQRSKDDKKNSSEHYYMNFLDHNGFTTEMKYTRLTLCVDFVKIERQYYRLYRVVDMKENAILFSTQIDTIEYPGTKLYGSNWDNIEDNTPLFRSMADSLRSTVMDFYEANTRNVIKEAKQYVSKGDHKAALYILAQYPENCHSYPQVRDCLAAFFRDYMKKDHKALLKMAKNKWNNRSSAVDARFVVALLNSENLTEREQKSADKLLAKVANAYPDIDIKAKDDYAYVPELKTIVISEAWKIAVEYSYSSELLENEDFTPKF